MARYWIKEKQEVQVNEGQVVWTLGYKKWKSLNF